VNILIFAFQAEVTEEEHKHEGELAIDVSTEKRPRFSNWKSEADTRSWGPSLNRGHT